MDTVPKVASAGENLAPASLRAPAKLASLGFVIIAISTTIRYHFVGQSGRCDELHYKYIEHALQTCVKCVIVAIGPLYIIARMSTYVTNMGCHGAIPVPYSP